MPAGPAICTMLFLSCRHLRVVRGYTVETTANGLAQANVVSAKGTGRRMAAAEIAAEIVASKLDEAATYLANRDAGCYGSRTTLSRLQLCCNALRR